MAKVIEFDIDGYISSYGYNSRYVKSFLKEAGKDQVICHLCSLGGEFLVGGVGGGHPPTRSPQEKKERKANFGTAVESCSKKLPDCRSLPTATFSGNRNQFFHKRLRAGVLPLFLAKTFPAAWSFPTIRRFRSCVLPAA